MGNDLYTALDGELKKLGTHFFPPCAACDETPSAVCYACSRKWKSLDPPTSYNAWLRSYLHPKELAAFLHFAQTQKVLTEEEWYHWLLARPEPACSNMDSTQKGAVGGGDTK